MRRNGGIIGKLNIPTNSVGSGVWGLREQLQSRRDDIWPRYVPTTINGIFDEFTSSTISLSGLDFKSGDNLFIFVYNENGTGGITFNTSGWTQINTEFISGVGRGAVYTKISDGTETSVSITPDAFTTSGLCAVAVDALYTYESVQGSITTSGSPDPLSIGSFATGDISLVFGAYGDDVVTVTQPSGYTLLTRGTSGSTFSGMSCAVAWRDDVSGTVDPGVFSGGNDENYDAHIRLSI